MAYSLCIRFQDSGEMSKRRRFADILACWPPSSEGGQLNVLEVGTLLAMQRGMADRYELPQNKPIDRICHVVNSVKEHDRAFTVETIWEVWRRELTAHQHCRYIRSSRFPDITFFGEDYSHSLGTVRVADEYGDVLIDFDPYMVETAPYDDTLLSEEDILKQKQNVQVFCSFLDRLLNRVRPSSLLLVPNIWKTDGVLAASIVFHQEAIEFVRDIMRSLVIMREFLLVRIAFATDDNGRINRESTYFSPSLSRPEETFTIRMLEELKKDCLRLIDMSRALDPKALREPLVCEPLLEVCNYFEEIKNWMNKSTEEDILDIIASFPNVNVSSTGGGWLAQHEQLGNANLTPLYLDLLKNILNKLA